MLSKTRTTVISLILSGSVCFAIGSLAPVASAAKNNGGYQQQAKARYPGGCTQAAVDFNNYENAAEAAEENHETKLAAEFHEVAVKIYNAGAAAGCWPAVRVSLGSSAPISTAAVGALP
jgi:hypothetical protein